MSNSRFLFQNGGFFHRLVGARGSASATLPSSHHNKDQQDAASTGSTSGQQPSSWLRKKPSNLGLVFHDAAAAKEIATSAKLVFFGEIHSRPPIIAFQRMVQNAMATTNSTNDEGGTLHVVMEHFSFDMQPLLEDYQNDKITFEELVQRYDQIGTEHHDLMPYQDLLEDAKRLHHNNNNKQKRRVQLHAGFLSRTYARQLMKEGPDVALQTAAHWLPTHPKLAGTEEHYNIFESLLTGRKLMTSITPPDDRFRPIFQAQLLKDVAMAHKIHNLLLTKQQSESGNSKQSDDRILVLLGNGHCLGYCGVPERVLEQHPELVSETCVIASHRYEQEEEYGIGDKNNESMFLKDHSIRGTLNLADYVYVYREEQDEEEQQQPPTTKQSFVKEETRMAYNKVGESAHIPGNAAKAMAIMKAMHYTDQQIAIAGNDVYNFQGVGNPHRHANIQPGDVVLDVGSGLGIDSFLAQHAATRTGFVLGVDISATQVRHAQACAQRRGCHERMRFVTADMESIPLPDASVDVVISNGAFCLAPNKAQAFREVYRVFKPGGRISICTTTTREESKLEPGVSWPVCMKMFVPMKDIEPMCQTIGFVNVGVDDSDSSMSMELPVEVMDENPNSPGQRNKVHANAAEFMHLEEYDMDAICARVCVVAEKPHDVD
ncbi:Arsenite methyltransferase [Seminavis robusta]|uniref:Arsenite methyltransferase n=1 Tax=Seminavis robusta TaxID=568900 RepID=A0A9N8H9N2_9STRA|nr:Arsenite methyltransferase [Seminavis robusta]|eukprot:Sro213_g088260.1 Arsenite methyltransferase (659) ;mRNA; r:1391-3367